MPATKTDAQFDRMTTQPVSRLVVSLAVPAIVSMMITNVYNLVDTAFVGTLGTSASGAFGVVFGFMSIIQAFGFMFGQGSGSIVSRALGQRDEKRASIHATMGFAAAFASGLAIALLCFWQLDRVVRLLGSTETIAPYTKTYISFILVAAPFMCSSFALNNVLRYEGTGHRGGATFLSGLRNGLLFIPLLLALSQLRGLVGIQEEQPPSGRTGST